MAFVYSSARFALRTPPLGQLTRLSNRTTPRPLLSRNFRSTPCAMATEKGAGPPVDLSQPTVFDKIISKEIPAKIIYEDELSLAFHDINPQAPTHVIVIPKRRIPMLSMATPDDKEILGHLMLTAAKVAELEGLQDGYRILVNNGKQGLQSVYHIHLHVIGGRTLKWGPF